MSNDPRKAYANLKHLKCKELPEYLRMMRPDCRDDFKDRAIGPRPPRPPPLPPAPFVPKTIPLYVGPDGTISPAIGGTILGVSALRKAERLRRGRSLYASDYETRTGRPPRARIAPARTMVSEAEAQRGSELRGLVEEEAPPPISSEPRIGEPLLDDGAGVVPRANPVIQESRLPPPPRAEARARPSTGRAMTPRAGGASAITGVSDIGSNPSVRPQTTPEPRRQLTQQRRITMPSAREGAGRSGVREPASLESWSDGGSGGIARDLPRADPPVTTQTRGGATFEGGGAGRGVGTEMESLARKRGTTTLRRRLSRVQGGDITSRPYGNLRMESFGVTAPEPVETERSEVIRSRGSIRGSGLATIPNSVESRIAPVPDDRMVDEFGATDPDLLPEMADDDLLRLPLVQRSTPKPRISAVRRALHAIDPQNRIQEAQRLIGNLVRPSPSAPSTSRNVPTQSESQLTEERQSLLSDQSDLQDLRDQISTTRNNIQTQRTQVADDQSRVTALQSEIQDSPVAQLSNTIEAGSEDIAQLADYGGEFAEGLNMGVGAEPAELERLGLISRTGALARAGARGLIGAIGETAGMVLQPVQMVGDQVAKVGGQVTARIGTSIGRTLGGEMGEQMGAQIARGISTGTRLAGGALGVVSGGGGPLDPVADAIGGAMLLAIPMEILGNYVMDQATGQTRYNHIKGATKMSFQTQNTMQTLGYFQKKIKKAMKGVPMDASNKDGKKDWWKQSTIQAHDQTAGELNQYMTNFVMQLVQHQANPDQYNQPIQYYDKQTKKGGIAVPLTRTQLARAIATYKENPDAFQNIDPLALKIMGLNPKMALGKIGAVKIQGIGYVPSVLAGTNKTLINLAGATDVPASQVNFKNPADNTATMGLFGPEGQIKFPANFNYSNFFINSQDLVNKGIMTDTTGAGYDGTKNYFSSNNPPLYNAENYSKVAQEYISQMPEGKARTYMQNQLAWFNYNNGVINQATRKPFSKPTQTISAPSDTATQNELTQAQADLQLEQSAYEASKGQLNSLDNQLAQETNTITTLQNQINTLSQTQTTTPNPTTNQQLTNYQNQANIYNRAVAENAETLTENLSAYNARYAEMTGMPTQVGLSGLTAQQTKDVANDLKNQIVATGVTSYQQNQLANLPRANPQQQQTTSSQGATPTPSTTIAPSGQQGNNQATSQATTGSSTTGT